MIEVVTVCKGFGDVLAVTLGENLPLIDNIVVITSPDDEETRSVCRRFSVHCVATNDWNRNGEFNKARMIQRGFDQIGGHDWILHLDADIVLPRKFRQMVDWAHLDPAGIYGVDRQNVVGWESWQALKRFAGAWDNHSHGVANWWHPHYQPGSRWVSSIHGWAPIGFFQLFHGSALIDNGYHIRNYTLTHGDAARTDVQFALQWDRRDRHLLPEVIALHLESEPAEIGANWRGRTTKPFRPDPGHHHPKPPPPPPHHPPSHPHHHPEPPPRHR